MTFAEMQSRVIFQLNADEDDLSDYLPHLTGYLNDGYDRLLYAITGLHTGTTSFPMLSGSTDAPKVPVWMHPTIADWATWLCYRNGNPQKQSRGSAYYQQFMEVQAKAAALRGSTTVSDDGALTISGNPPQFTGVYP